MKKLTKMARVSDSFRSYAVGDTGSYLWAEVKDCDGTRRKVFFHAPDYPAAFSIARTLKSELAASGSRIVFSSYVSARNGAPHFLNVDENEERFAFFSLPNLPEILAAAFARPECQMA